MCIFCEEIKNPRLVKKVFGQSFKYNSRIIYSDKNILAIPGYGPQVYPYILEVFLTFLRSYYNQDSMRGMHYAYLSMAESHDMVVQVLHIVIYILLRKSMDFSMQLIGERIKRILSLIKPTNLYTAMNIY